MKDAKEVMKDIMRAAKCSLILSWLCPAAVAIATGDLRVCLVWAVPIICTAAILGEKCRKVKEDRLRCGSEE